MPPRPFARDGTKILASSADTGLVVVHITNLFPHQQMNGRDAVDGDILAVREFEQLERLFEINLRGATAPIRQSLVTSLKRDAKRNVSRLAGVLYVAHSLAYFRELRQRIGRGLFQPLTDSQDAIAFANMFTLFWQDLPGRIRCPCEDLNVDR